MILNLSCSLKRHMTKRRGVTMTNEQNDQIMQAIKELHEQMNDGFVKIDKRFEEVDKRFEEVDKRFDLMHQEMNTRFDEIDKRFDEMNETAYKLKDSMDLLAKKNFENETEIHRIKKAIGQY